MSEQYRICPECGSSLDPEEKCDCMTIIQHTFILGLGLSAKDGSVISILTGVGDDGFKYVKHFKGEEAEELYEKLTNNKIIKEIK